MKNSLIQAVFLLAVASVTGSGKDLLAVEVEDASQIDIGPYVEAFHEKGKPPIEYLVEKFKRHDILLVGEEHGVRENCEFVASAIEPLYHQAGVRVLATEFLRTSNAVRVDRLVHGASFDHNLALAIMRDYAWPTWGYAEYLDILKSAWRLNASLPANSERLRVVPLDSDWSQHDLFYKHTTPLARFEVMRDRERHMTRVLEDEVLSPNHKAIAHIGFQHSLLTQGERLGTALHRQYGQRVTQVCLHHRFSDPRGASTVAQLIDRAFHDYDAGPIGLDIASTPFASLRDPNNQAFTFGGDHTLGKLAKGYIVLAPLDELHNVQWIGGFITKDTYNEALEVAVKMGQADPQRETSPEKLNARMRQVIESR